MTAKEFRLQQNLLPDLAPLKVADGITLNGNDRIEKLMIEFAKLHVTEALKQASEQVYVSNTVDCEIDRNSVLNAYNINEIK